MPRFSPSGFFGPSRCLIKTPGLTSKYPICAVCACVCVYTHTHPHTLPPALKIEKTQTTPLSLLLSKITLHAKQQVSNFPLPQVKSTNQRSAETAWPTALPLADWARATMDAAAAERCDKQPWTGRHTGVQAKPEAQDTALHNRLLLCFMDPRVRKIRNDASSCPGMSSSTLRLYYVASPPSSSLPHLLTDIENM